MISSSSDAATSTAAAPASPSGAATVGTAAAAVAAAAAEKEVEQPDVLKLADGFDKTELVLQPTDTARLRHWLRLYAPGIVAQFTCE
eukprot:m.260961 g.260961  ORF g.260961 m.260961 type:complete len:87 (-) comp22743_c4_seq1:37-297(-)